MKDFEIVESTRMKKISDNEIIYPTGSGISQTNGRDKLANAVADNFDSILNLANSLVEIEKMKVQSGAIIRKMEEDRLTLIAEAEVYAKKKNADTKDVVDKMNVVRYMMQDFYAYNNTNMTGEDFSKMIQAIVMQMGKL